MAEPRWDYEKLMDDGKIKTISGDYMNDTDGSITGQIVMNVKAWFDENPEYWKAHGWTKHIRHDTKEIEYNRQTQFLSQATRQVDEYTIEDVYYVLDKSEDQLAFEEMLAVAQGGGGYIEFV